MKQLYTVIMFLICCLIADFAMAAEKTVSIATLNWPPYAGEKLKNYGFTSEIITEAFKRVGYKTTFVFFPWKRALRNVEYGKYDAVSCAYYSKQRDETFLISDSYVESKLGFLKRVYSDIHYKQLADLKPYRIGVTLGYVNTPEFDAAVYLNKDPAITDEQSIKKLFMGRIDLALMDKYVGLYFIDNALEDGRSAIEFIEPPLAVNPLYLMFSRKISGNEQKMKAFNKGLKIIRDDGTQRKILKAHGLE